MRRNGLIVSLGLMKEAFSFYIKKLFNKKKSTWEYKSLRKIIDEDFVQPYSGSSEMIQIRKGQ